MAKRSRKKVGGITGSEQARDPKALRAGHCKATLSLPVDLLRAAKHAAFEEDVFLSQLVAELLECDPRVRRYLKAA